MSIQKVKRTAWKNNSPEAFQKIGGRFVYCENELDFAEQLVTLASDSGWEADPLH